MIKLTTKKPEEYSGDMIAYLVEEDIESLPGGGEHFINRILHGSRQKGGFKAKAEEVFLFYPGLISKDGDEKCKAKRILFVGLGKQEESVAQRMEQLRIAGGVIASQARSFSSDEVLVVLPSDIILSAPEIAESVTEGLLLGNYQFTQYKTDQEAIEKNKAVASFILSDGGLSPTAVRRGMNRGKISAEATFAARDMANHPGNGWTANEFADYAKKLAKKNRLKCKVLEKTALKKLGMGGILGVNQGSADPPKMVVLEYKTHKKNPTVLLVGKGLTFDSGGVSLKPAAGMEEMKYDMCGGAAVLGAMRAVAMEEPDCINVIAIIPTTDNMSGGAALKPGDVITHYGGKTSEIINTDAEGRLILADALAYGIETYSPEAIVDLATLTGAVIIGLGHHTTGVLSNNDILVKRLVEAGDRAGEPLWRLPLGKEYRKQIDSTIADIKNTGGKSAGTITAACYLQEFVGDVPWAHLDIAGTAWDFTEKSYIPKGPSGTGVRTLLNMLRQWKTLAVNEDK